MSIAGESTHFRMREEDDMLCRASASGPSRSFCIHESALPPGCSEPGRAHSAMLLLLQGAKSGPCIQLEKAGAHSQGEEGGE
jgi:hypothetical protein